MKYVGSKNRIASEIMPYILMNMSCGIYIESFVGGANLIDKIPAEHKRIGLDINRNTINALVMIRDHVDKLPKNNSEFTENDYKKIKKDPDNALYSYVGFCLSYGGKWFGGWCRDGAGKRDYVREAYNNAKKQTKKIQGVSFRCLTYEKTPIIKNSVIYCDPPYKNTTGYNTGEFCHEKFWAWARKVSKTNSVFISEYTAPNDFHSIWSKRVCSSLDKNTGAKKNVERLFVHRHNVGKIKAKNQLF